MSIASCRRNQRAAKQRKALKARFCEWRGVNSNSLRAGLTEVKEWNKIGKYINSNRVQAAGKGSG